MLNIEFSFPGKQLAAGFHVMGRGMKDLSPAMDEAAGDCENDMKKQFSREGRGERWDELSEMTKHVRTEMGYSEGPILHMGGNLEKSFTTPGAEGHVRQINKMSMMCGSDYKVAGGRYVLAELHTEGYSVTVTPKMAVYFAARFKWPLKVGSRLEVPPRKVMDISPAAIKSMMTRVQRHILNHGRKSFRGLAYVVGNL